LLVHSAINEITALRKLCKVFEKNVIDELAIVHGVMSTCFLSC